MLLERIDLLKRTNSYEFGLFERTELLKRIGLLERIGLMIRLLGTIGDQITRKNPNE